VGEARRDFTVASGSDEPEEGVAYVLGPRTELRFMRSEWAVGRRAIVRFVTEGDGVTDLYAKVLTRGHRVEEFCVDVWDGRRTR
jgi:hypothetical protein